MPPASDPYRALGVARGATAADIKKAHRRLAKRFHPDTKEGDARRFLVIQEAYRVLSDPLLRRDWDALHAPGPLRATDTPRKKAPTTRTQPSQPRPPRQPRAGAHRTETTGKAPPPGAQPRSSRSYTWSASEVPWWEEGIKHNAAKRATRRARAGAEPAEERAAVPDFEVFNRSSGAAWSMAARAYFRKTDADLPSRGVFREQSGQPLTGGKARAAAEAERRARPADAAPDETANGGGEVRPGRGER